MNFQNILLNIQTQGPAFWAAALAMALGATLLIVSLVTQARRIQNSGSGFYNLIKLSGLKRRQKPSESGVSSQPKVTINKTEDVYQPSSVSPLSPGPTQNTPLVDNSNELATRLHNAANTLEEIRQGLRQDKFTPGFSALKHDVEGVEYLFKTTAV